jgi:hypothetical protein
MIDTTRVYRCACKSNGLAHVFTAASTKPHIVMVDPGCAHLLRDVMWGVSRVHSNSKLLRARASTAASGIKLGSQLHQLVMRVRRKGRRVWALNRNYLDARRANLRPMSFADTRILSTSRPSTQAVGVARPQQPAFFKTLLRPFQMRIKVAGKGVSLWFTTLEAAQV